jgi:Lrp/AsnC family leucine-responsive transcriptional regulator
MIDDIDRQILTILQENARTSNAEIARQVGMAPSAILERIRRLETKGVIEGYEVRINPEAVGLSLLAFVSVASTDRAGDTSTAELLSHIPEIQEAHHIAGDDCYLLKVRVANTKALSHLLRDRIGSLDTIRSTRTTVVLDTLHERRTLALAPAAIVVAGAASDEDESREAGDLVA